MKRIVFFSLLCGLILLMVGEVYAQGYVFGPNVRVSDYPPGSAYAYTPNAGQRGVAVRADTVYCAWSDNRTGGDGVWFAKSIDGGETFLPNVQVDDGLGKAYTSTIAVGNDGSIYFAWYGKRPGFSDYLQVFFSKSTDGGITFTPDVLVNDTAGGIKNYNHSEPSMLVDTSENIYIAFHDGRNGGPGRYDIYFSKSTDGGLSFTQDVLVNDTIAADSMWALSPSLALSDDGVIYVSWSNWYDWLYVSKSTDGGMSFGSDIQVNDTITESWTNSMEVDSRGYVHILWADMRDSNWNIYYSRSTDGGLTFSPNIRVNDSINEPDPQCFSSMCVDDSGMVYAVWEDGLASYSDIFFTLSTDTGDSVFVEPNVEVDNSDSLCAYPSVALGDSGKVYVMWIDFRNGFFTNEVYFAVGKYESGIEEGEEKREERRVSISAPFPNPFSHRVEIRYCIGQSAKGNSSAQEHRSIGAQAEVLELRIYDVSGRLVKDFSLGTGHLALGNVVTWDGRDDKGEVVASGVYFLKGKIGNQEVNEQIIYLR